MEGKASFVILLAIVAFLSLTLALLTGYVFFMQGHPVTGSSEEHDYAGVLPKDEEIFKDKLFEAKRIFNLKAEPGSKPTMLQVSAELVYFKEVPGIKSTGTKIATYKSDIVELVSTYFLNVRAEEVKTPEGKEKIKSELIKKANALLKANEKSKNDIIYNIVFDDWLVMST